MNRIDRVTAILIQLQSKRVVKAQEIADRFSISLRTVYRDIKALEESGVPLAGEAGVGYSIMEGYRLPPVMFTREEAIAFLTAEKMVEKLTDPSSVEQYQSAMFKIKSVLRYAEKDLLDDMSAYIEVVENPYLSAAVNKPVHLQTILNGIANKAVMNIGYFANHSQQYSNRDVEPVGIFYQANYWYMIAYCRLRNDYRSFRADRISYINITENHFHKLHPSLKSFLNKINKEQEMLTIVIQVDKTVLKYFGEQKFYNGFVSQKAVGDKMEMIFVTASLQGFAKYYMMFGEYADIISPSELKDMVKQNIEAITKKLSAL
jgi:predicted DNA-binding transcriptional regulator YafY